ncbi:unnamed protein product [Lampetra planeri]
MNSTAEGLIDKIEYVSQNEPGPRPLRPATWAIANTAIANTAAAASTATTIATTAPPRAHLPTVPCCAMRLKFRRTEHPSEIEPDGE